MPNTIDERPPVAVGHVRLPCSDVAAAARWLETVGLRSIVQMDELAVLELRGGTHVVVRKTEPPVAGTAAPFDLMVVHCYRAQRLAVYDQLLARQRQAGVRILKLLGRT
jgi:hypothetical protein